MPINMIIIIIFFVALVFVALLYRNSTLDKLPLLTGEKVLFEENGVRVEQGGSPRSVIYINCIIRITDMRIIIAQKMLLSGKYALRHVFLFSGLSDSTDLKTTLSKGYLNMTIHKSDVKVSDSDGTCIIRIDIPASALTRNQYITYKTSGRDYYLNLL